MTKRFYSPGEIEVLVLLDDHGPMTLKELSDKRSTITRSNARGATLRITRRLTEEGVLINDHGTLSLNAKNERAQKFREEKQLYDTKAVLNALERMPAPKL